MKDYNIDFHIHSRESGGTSPDMSVPNIASQAPLKGLDCVGTGDALNPRWLAHLRENLKVSGEGVYAAVNSDTRFIVSTEVEDARRVHHIILLPSLEAAEQLSLALKKHSVDIEKDGRPHVRLSGAEIVDEAREVGGLVGPSHAFTPWTAVYKEYDSLRDCYQDNLKYVHFLELGLSADSDMADRIAELADIVLTSNSDCHSPWPNRLGREFNRLRLEEISFPEIVKALRREGGRAFTLNVGLNPREGKYHLTACTRCFTRYHLKDAVSLKMRCSECKGTIKKGVSDRVNELASWDTPHHPPHRPPYVRILPLAEVICLARGVSNPQAKKVQDEWMRLVRALGSEINVLIDAPIESVKKIDSTIGALIARFREGSVPYVAGGGGQYGRPTLKGEKDAYWGRGQKKLADY
jgi:uncharacterized protein (TIGR00375 family)